MSAAALPPIVGTSTAEDQRHPRFGEYRIYRSWCARQMIDCPGFKTWLGGVEREERLAKIAEHPRFKDFQNWMRDTKAGGRKCPAGHGAFPDNFNYWLEGGRW